MTLLERVLVSILEIAGTGILIVVILPIILYWSWLALKIGREIDKETKDE